MRLSSPNQAFVLRCIAVMFLLNLPCDHTPCSRPAHRFHGRAMRIIPQRKPIAWHFSPSQNSQKCRVFLKLVRSKGPMILQNALPCAWTSSSWPHSKLLGDHVPSAGLLNPVQQGDPHSSPKGMATMSPHRAEQLDPGRRRSAKRERLSSYRRNDDGDDMAILSHRQNDSVLSQSNRVETDQHGLEHTHQLDANLT